MYITYSYYIILCVPPALIDIWRALLAYLFIRWSCGGDWGYRAIPLVSLDLELLPGLHHPYGYPLPTITDELDVQSVANNIRYLFNLGRVTTMCYETHHFNNV